MEAAHRVFMLWMLLAAIASHDMVIPVLGRCGHPRHSCGGGSYSPPTHTTKPPSTSKSPCPSSGSPPSSPSPCTKPPSSSSSCPKTPSTPTPTTPSPSTPTTPAPILTPTPLTPTPVTPTPWFPMTPSTPMAPIFTQPFFGTCDYWRNHPELITPLLGYWGSIASCFGSPPISSMFGGGIPTIPQALGCTYPNGYGALVRQGTAAFLNSVANRSGFPYSAPQVQDSFLQALASEGAAAAQAALFQAANEGRVR